MKASSYVYGIALRPLLAEYEADIDQELQRWRAKCSQLVQSAFLIVLQNFNLDALSAWFTNPNRVVGSLISFVFPMDIAIRLVHDSHI